MAMIDLNDAMRVLINEGFLDPRYSNDEGYPEYVRSELEQKSWLMGDTRTEVKAYRETVACLNMDNILAHIANGDLSTWLRSIRAQLDISMEALLREADKHAEPEGNGTGDDMAEE